MPYDGWRPSRPFRPLRFAPYPGPGGGAPRGPPRFCGPPGGQRPPLGPQFCPEFRPPPEWLEIGPPRGPGFRPGFRPGFGRSPGPAGFPRPGHERAGPKSVEEQNFETRRFLTDCGIPKDIIDCLPNALVAMITRKRCNLCDVVFMAFDQARLHYNSTKHKKSMDKWLAANGFDQPKIKNAGAEPLKSRDVYCELCDVQITSQSHGAAHYAGRPHQAVVHGRKMPKNVALCEPGMQARMLKLINREKRLGVPTLPPAVPAETRLKEVPPELICAICKTSATNSDQMAMHLNGKRHLAKEKSYILNIMKGGSQTAVDGETEEIKEEAAKDEKISAEDY